VELIEIQLDQVEMELLAEVHLLYRQAIVFVLALFSNFKSLKRQIFQCREWQVARGAASFLFFCVR
jgi:hypothetical protein